MTLWEAFMIIVTQVFKCSSVTMGWPSWKPPLGHEQHDGANQYGVVEQNNPAMIRGVVRTGPTEVEHTTVTKIEAGRPSHKPYSCPFSAAFFMRLLA